MSVMDIAMLLRQCPHAAAKIRGSGEYPEISGEVRFYQTKRGVLVVAEIFGLPRAESSCKAPVFGFHLHGGGECGGNATDPFADALTHFNPQECSHPHHAGDLPPLFGNDGYAFLACVSDRFSVSDIIGRTVIIHSAADDFTTQPSGNAGSKIACGVIRKCRGK